MRLTEEQQKLAEKNHNLIYGFLHMNGYSIEQYYDVAAIGYCKAMATYSPDKGVKLSVYVTACMRNEMFMFFRHAKRQIENHKTISIFDSPMDNPDLEIGDCISDPKDLISSQILMNDLNSALKSLSERERYLILLSASGVAQSKIAHQMGVTQSYVSKLLEAVRLKIKDAMGIEQRATKPRRKVRNRS